ncbi:MAG: hypothetical protein CMIDDMOC_00356 [Sodalis sp. Fle]|nr:MAG: hypothetical protein CMIDDMOC_00356 [Sodalis sp. Fle]
MAPIVICVVDVLKDAMIKTLICYEIAQYSYTALQVFCEG